MIITGIITTTTLCGIVGNVVTTSDRSLGVKTTYPGRTRRAPNISSSSFRRVHTSLHYSQYLRATWLVRNWNLKKYFFSAGLYQVLVSANPVLPETTCWVKTYPAVELDVRLKYRRRVSDGFIISAHSVSFDNYSDWLINLQKKKTFYSILAG